MLGLGNTMTRSGSGEVPRILAGSLRPDDARRFYVEAMVGAMHADGDIDGRELRALRRVIGDHALFASLPDSVADGLIELSSDALAFAGGADRRVPVIAGNLRWRIDRLAAFAMACEVCAVADALADRQARYLDTLGAALRLGEREQRALLAAAREGGAMAWLEAEVARVRGQLPAVAGLLLLRGWRGGPLATACVSDAVGYLVRVRDFAPTGHARAAVEAVRRTAVQWTSAAEVVPELLAELPFASDRYWTMVYLLGHSLIAGHGHWADDAVIVRLAGAFHYGDGDMQLACDDAAQLAAHLAGG